MDQAPSDPLDSSFPVNLEIQAIWSLESRRRALSPTRRPDDARGATGAARTVLGMPRTGHDRSRDEVGTVVAWRAWPPWRRRPCSPGAAALPASAATPHADRLLRGQRHRGGLRVRRGRRSYGSPAASQLTLGSPIVGRGRDPHRQGLLARRGRRRRLHLRRRRLLRVGPAVSPPRSWPPPSWPSPPPPPARATGSWAGTAGSSPSATPATTGSLPVAAPDTGRPHRGHRRHPDRQGLLARGGRRRRVRLRRRRLLRERPRPLGGAGPLAHRGHRRHHRRRGLLGRPERRGGVALR